VNLIIFVCGAEGVHRNVDCEANGLFALTFPARNDRMFPGSAGLSLERTTQVMLAEKYLSVGTSPYGFERRRPLDPAYGSIEKIE
jgi:hypothetical protein